MTSLHYININICKNYWNHDIWQQKQRLKSHKKLWQRLIKFNKRRVFIKNFWSLIFRYNGLNLRRWCFNRLVQKKHFILIARKKQEIINKKKKKKKKEKKTYTYFCKKKSVSLHILPIKDKSTVLIFNKKKVKPWILSKAQRHFWWLTSNMHSKLLTLKKKLLLLRSRTFKKWYFYFNNMHFLFWILPKQMKYVQKRKCIASFASFYCTYGWLYEPKNDSAKLYWYRYFDTRFGSFFFQFGLFFFDLKFYFFDLNLFKFLYAKNNDAKVFKVLHNTLNKIALFINQLIMFFYLREFLYFKNVKFTLSHVNTLVYIYYFFFTDLYYFSNNDWKRKKISIRCIVSKWKGDVMSYYPIDFFLRYLSCAGLFNVKQKRKNLQLRLKYEYFKKSQKVNYIAFEWFYRLKRKCLSSFTTRIHDYKTSMVSTWTYEWMLWRDRRC